MGKAKKPAGSIGDIIKKNQSIKLDLACGANKQKGFVGMDVRALPGVDIVHDITSFPWPIPSETVSVTVASHVMEHIPKDGTPGQLKSLINLLIKKGVLSKKEVATVIGEYEVFSYLMRTFDEVWRITKEGGQFAFVVPYAGSIGYWQDPTHVAPITEALLGYFDPEHPSGLWNIYKPKPWKIELAAFQMAGNLEVVLIKRNLDPKYEAKWK